MLLTSAWSKLVGLDPLFILCYFILFSVGGGIVAADERIEQLVGLVPLLLLHLKNLVIKPASSLD